jgi:hypothetical protein
MEIAVLSKKVLKWLYWLKWLNWLKSFNYAG